jgi:lysozyme family protein
MPTLSELKPEYELLFSTCRVNAGKQGEIDTIAGKIIANQARYQAIGKPLGIPWYFVGVVHQMECNLRFDKHLHNGDPLTARTVQVPKGMPKTGTPPFTFEFSANDALVHMGYDKVTDWSTASILFLFEKYNGFGYRRPSIRINSPYLWSYSNHYTKGKYASDGKFDPNLVSKQAGAAVVLRRLSELQAISFSDQQMSRLREIRELGERVRYAPNTVNTEAMRLQDLLNLVGYALQRDGKAGERTSNAYREVSRKYLPGDPRRGG